MKIFDISFDYIPNIRALHAYIEDVNRKTNNIVTINAEFLQEAKKNPEFKSIIEENICTLDAASMIWFWRYEALPKYLTPIGKWIIAGASLVLHPKPWKYQPDRISGSDILEYIHDKRIYLLGGDPDSARLAKEYVEKTYPNISVVGAETGPLFSITDNTDIPFKEILNDIKEKQPDIVFVGFGAPKQEFWIQKYKYIAPHAIWIGVGGAIDYWSGQKKRAPKYMRHVGLEWLWRLITEPQRFFRILSALKFSVDCMQKDM